MMKYLYSYNLPQKSDDIDLGDKKLQGGNNNLFNTLNNLRNICATVPVEFHHEQGRT